MGPSGPARDLERVLAELPINEDVWLAAYELARRARTGGITLPATDIVIAACARRHGAALETADSDFDALSTCELPVDAACRDRVVPPRAQTSNSSVSLG